MVFFLHIMGLFLLNKLYHEQPSPGIILCVELGRACVRVCVRGCVSAVFQARRTQHWRKCPRTSQSSLCSKASVQEFQSLSGTLRARRWEKASAGAGGERVHCSLLSCLVPRGKRIGRGTERENVSCSDVENGSRADQVSLLFLQLFSPFTFAKAAEGLVLLITVQQVSPTNGDSTTCALSSAREVDWPREVCTGQGRGWREGRTGGRAGAFWLRVRVRQGGEMGLAVAAQAKP